MPQSSPSPDQGFDPVAGNAPSAPQSTEGMIDVANPHRVGGWVWDPARPAVRLTVSIEVNRSLVATVTADAFRNDLVRAGKGDGRHSFEILLPGTGPRDGDSFRCFVAESRYTLPVGCAARDTRPSKATSTASSPVFILGSPRSGTTILASALKKSGYFGFNEGHLLNLLIPIKAVIEQHFTNHFANEKGQLLSQIDRDALIEAVTEVFKKFQSALNPTEPWFDKTPDRAMIVSTTLLTRLWPTAVFVFAKRRGIENVVSRMKKFPDASFEAHCRSWAETMAAWRDVRDGGIRRIEIDQYDIAHDPAATAARLGSFLGLGKDENARMADEMTNGRPQRTDEESTHRILALEDCGWTQPQIAAFRTHCSHEMKAYGYTEDKRYRQAGTGDPD